METEKTELEEQLRLLEDKIQDVKGRMPAHSVKPAIMHELFELEDKKEILTRRLRELAG